MPTSLLRNLVLCARLGAALLGCAILQAGQSRESALDPSTANQPIRDMHLMTSSQGWVLAGQHILWTDNLGQNRTDITPSLATTQSIDTVYFLDAYHGWAMLHAGGITDLPSLFTASTADGGKSWSVRPFQASSLLLQGYGYRNDLSFVDPGHGWLLMHLASSSALSRGALFATEDGGKTWSALPDPPIAGKIQFLSASTGWLVGGVHGDELYRTQDEGQTWIRKIVPLPDQVRPYIVSRSGGTYVSHPFYDDLSFQAPDKGLLVLLVHVTEMSTDLLTYSTDDGGGSWQLQSMETDLSGVGPLAIFDSTFLEASYTGGVVSLRNGSAKTSAPLPADLPTTLQVSKVEFRDPQHGWLLLGGAQTALAGTDDGGKTVKVFLKGAGTSPPPKGPLKSQSETGVQPAIGGVTGANGVGIDTCQNIPIDYINSLFGEYGEEVKNGNYWTVYGFYLGGLTAVAANCSIASSSFISGTACSGWQYLPIWDGYQAPCNTGMTYRISTNLTTAAAEGVGDADSAAQQLVNIGLSGSVAYLDIESYATGNASCSQAVQTYVNAWVGEMHRDGYYAGVYGSGYNIGQDMVPGVIANVPDDIWVANYNGQAVTSPLAGVPNSLWVNTQRAHQYQGPTVLISNQPSYQWDLDAVNSTVAEMLDVNTNCDEGCEAACYNGSSQRCGSICLNCDECTCVNGKCTGCPIIIDPTGQGFHLTSLENGVEFALKAGQLAQVSWTDPKYQNAWLALDRNGNGTIDNFTELFGNLTPQPPGPDPNGYKALAVFDDPQNGGNGNGRIDPGDAIYSHLRLWIDKNHNGFSEPDELIPLAEAGIFSIDLRYRQNSYTDQFGNQFRYVSQIADEHGKDDPRCYDVYLQVGLPPTEK